MAKLDSQEGNVQQAVLTTWLTLAGLVEGKPCHRARSEGNHSSSEVEAYLTSFLS
jgi:hypothetical protein